MKLSPESCPFNSDFTPPETDTPGYICVGVLKVGTIWINLIVIFGPLLEDF